MTAAELSCSHDERRRRSARRRESRPCLSGLCAPSESGYSAAALLSVQAPRSFLATTSSRCQTAVAP
jgi:hypothetical protein